jgi:hypothetical protein
MEPVLFRTIRKIDKVLPSTTPTHRTEIIQEVYFKNPKSYTTHPLTLTPTHLPIKRTFHGGTIFRENIQKVLNKASSLYVFSALPPLANISNP